MEMKELEKYEKGIPLASLESFDWETFVSFGQIFRAYKDASQWALGDLATGIESKYGEQSLGKYAIAIGIAYKTLVGYRRVAQKYPRSRRMVYLSFSHHQRALKASQPFVALEYAHDNNLSIAQFDKYLADEKAVGCQHQYEKYNICINCGNRIKI